jgi:hypothetical protein
LAFIVGVHAVPRHSPIKALGAKALMAQKHKELPSFAEQAK